MGSSRMNNNVLDNELIPVDELEENSWYIGENRGMSLMFWNGTLFCWLSTSKVTYSGVEVKQGGHWNQGGPCRPYLKWQDPFVNCWSDTEEAENRIKNRLEKLKKFIGGLEDGRPS